MFRIGEFSKLVRVSARMLRHYEKCGLLHPAEIDRFTGYRLYSAAQIPLLARIVALRDMGFGVDEMDEILPHFDNARYMQSILAQKRDCIASGIAAEQIKLEKIAAMREILKKGCVEMIYEVELKELPAVQVLALRERVPAYEAEFALWEKMARFTKQNNIACNLNGYSIYHDDEYKETDIDIEIAVPVQAAGADSDGFVYKELAAVLPAAAIRFSGPYESYDLAMEKMAAWLEHNGYIFAGGIRGLAIEGPQSQSDPANYLTELQVPVKKL